MPSTAQATAHAIPATLAPEGAGLRPQAAPANQTWTPEELEKLRQPMKDLKAAAQQFLWAKPRNDKDFEHFAALLRKTVVPIGPNNKVEYDLRQRMLISEGRASLSSSMVWTALSPPPCAVPCLWHGSRGSGRSYAVRSAASAAWTLAAASLSAASQETSTRLACPGARARRSRST